MNPKPLAALALCLFVGAGAAPSLFAEPGGGDPGQPDSPLVVYGGEGFGQNPPYVIIGPEGVPYRFFPHNGFQNAFNTYFIQKGVPNGNGHLYNENGLFVGDWQPPSGADNEWRTPAWALPENVVAGPDGVPHIYTMTPVSGFFDKGLAVYRDDTKVVYLPQGNSDFKDPQLGQWESWYYGPIFGNDGNVYESIGLERGELIRLYDEASKTWETVYTLPHAKPAPPVGFWVGTSTDPWRPNLLSWGVTADGRQWKLIADAPWKGWVQPAGSAFLGDEKVADDVLSFHVDSHGNYYAKTSTDGGKSWQLIANGKQVGGSDSATLQDFGNFDDHGNTYFSTPEGYLQRVNLIPDTASAQEEEDDAQAP